MRSTPAGNSSPRTAFATQAANTSTVSTFHTSVQRERLRASKRLGSTNHEPRPMSATAPTSGDSSS